MAELLVPIERIPSQTLLRSAAQDAKHLDRVNREYVALHVIRSSGSVVWIVESRLPRRAYAPMLYAVKKQVIAEPTLSHKAYRELRIALRLRQLWETHRSPNFVRLYSWFKTDGLYEPFQPSAAASPSKSTTTTPREALYYVLEYADCTLLKYKPTTVQQFRSVLFQLINALFVAQHNCNFMHNDLHRKNILIQDIPDVRLCVYCDHGAAWYVTGPIVKISDFGLSRCRLGGGELIYNPVHSYAAVFSPLPDLLKIVAEFQAPRSLFADADDDDGWAAYRDLRAAAGRGVYPLQLIHHRFFAPLRVKPDAGDLPAGATLYFSCDGSVRNQADLDAHMARYASMETASLTTVLELQRDELLHDSGLGSRVRVTPTPLLDSYVLPVKTSSRRKSAATTTVEQPSPVKRQRRSTADVDPGYLRKFSHVRTAPTIEDSSASMSLSRQIRALEQQAYQKPNWSDDDLLRIESDQSNPSDLQLELDHQSNQFDHQSELDQFDHQSDIQSHQSDIQSNILSDLFLESDIRTESHDLGKNMKNERMSLSRQIRAIEEQAKLNYFSDPIGATEEEQVEAGNPSSPAREEPVIDDDTPSTRMSLSRQIRLLEQQARLFLC